MLELINQFNGGTLKYFKKCIEFFTFRFNSDQFYKHSFKKFLEIMSKTINLRLTCIKSHLDGRLVETVDKIKISFKSFFSSQLKTLNVNPVDERQNLTLEADILKSKQIFDSVMNNLRVDILLIHVVTQQKQLEETLTDLSHVETST